MRIVMPDWAKPHWDASECTVEKLANSKDKETHAVVDHNLQTTIAIGTLKECEDFLKNRF